MTNIIIPTWNTRFFIRNEFIMRKNIRSTEAHKHCSVSFCLFQLGVIHDLDISVSISNMANFNPLNSFLHQASKRHCKSMPDKINTLVLSEAMLFRFPISNHIMINYIFTLYFLFFVLIHIITYYIITFYIFEYTTRRNFAVEITTLIRPPNVGTMLLGFKNTLILTFVLK